MIEGDSSDAADITQLLQDWRGGGSDALERLLPLVYPDLKEIADSYLRRERANHTLQPTALVNEAYLRLHKRCEVPYESRKHFLCAAAKAMRHILVDHARRLSAGKRFNPADRVTLTGAALASLPVDIDLLALDQAIERLTAANGRQASIVEMRFFGGLTNHEVADVLGVSEPTVRRDWKVASLALRQWLTEAGPP